MEELNPLRRDVIEILKKAEKPIRINKITLIVGDKNYGTYPAAEAMYRLDEILRKQAEENAEN